MATDNLPPLFQQGDRDSDIGSLLRQDPQLQDDSLISELLAGQGDDLLASLLDASVYPNTSSSDYVPLNFDLDPTHLLYPQNSPLTSDGYVSDSSTLYKTNSPTSYSSVSGNSPVYEGASPGHSPLVSSSVLEQPGPGEDISTLLGFGEAMEPRLVDDMEPSISSTAESLSRDVTIDVEPVGPESTVSDRKAATLVLTEDEKRLLAEEGITLPTDMVLTKAEQKHLKRIRRKIKNKISAKESRQRKKEYVEGLEERVSRCTDVNRRLLHRVNSLESENKSMLTQLRKLQAIVAQYNPSRLQAGTMVMVLVLSFSLFFVPRLHSPGLGGGYQSIRVHSRSLLFTDTDDFGNVIDQETGQVISAAGGQSPSPFPPWIHQTPAVNFLNTSLQKEVQNHARHEPHSDRTFLPP